MAIGRLSVGVGSKGKASPHAMYIAREGKYAKDDNDLEKLESTGHGNMPRWAEHDPNFFWKMSDEHERKNGTSYREHVIALPRELPQILRTMLIKKWIEQEVGDKHAYQYAIHNPPALDGGEQPHAHIMFSERLRDSIERDPAQYFKRHNPKKPERGGAKKANIPKPAAERKQELKAQRDRWEKLCNLYLQFAKSDARISMKSLKDQGIDREPVNISMSQINKPAIRQAYKKQLTSAIEFKQAKLDSLTVNVIDELAAIKISEKYYEQADRAIARTKQRVSETARDTQRAAAATQQVLHRVDKTKQLAEVTDRAINRTQRCFDSSKRLAAVADKAIISSQQAVTRRLEQQLERISQRPISELLRLEFRVQVVNEYGNNRSETVARVNDDFYDYYRRAKREKMQLVISNKDRNGKLTNPETEGNKTAQAIERFMMKKENLSNLNILDDFDSKMSIQDFTKKYRLECDISDLKRLDELYPIEPKQTPKAANLSEPRPKNDNDHGFSM